MFNDGKNITHTETNIWGPAVHAKRNVEHLLLIR